MCSIKNATKDEFVLWMTSNEIIMLTVTSKGLICICETIIRSSVLNKDHIHRSLTL